MDKRYQVFVSSTFADLKDERREVMQALMEFDCIPAGMELFPSADEEQFSFITKVIDDCDYYVLIIGGRYGSTTQEGISYTEKEYEYAKKKGVPVLSFVHENPAKLAMEKSDVDSTLRTKLTGFRSKVMSGNLVKLWSDPKGLPGLVALSLAKAIKTHPAVGWVRANQIANAAILAELNEVRKKNEELQKQFERTSPQLTNIAGLNSKVAIRGTGGFAPFGDKHDWQITTTWGKVFGGFAPHLLSGVTENNAKEIFTDLLKRIYKGTQFHYFYVNDDDFQQAKIQFIALNLMAQRGPLLNLTDFGRNTLIQLRAVREPAAKQRGKKK
jgi:hypothetical protein